MKLFFAILLMSMVLCSELVSVFDIGMVEISHLDSSYEGEVEKELSENLEDVLKIKFDAPKFSDSEKEICNNDSLLNWLISTPYLEIDSPPPDHF